MDDNNDINDKTSFIGKGSWKKGASRVGGIAPTAFSPIHSTSNVATEKNMQLAPLVSKPAKGSDATASSAHMGNPMSVTPNQSSQRETGGIHKSAYGIATSVPTQNALSVKPGSLQGSYGVCRCIDDDVAVRLAR